MFAFIAACLNGQAAERTFFDYSLATFEGQNAPLASYKDKVVLLVVVADKSEYSPQLAKLDELYKRRKEAGLEVIGVVSNEFGGEAVSSKTDLAKIYREQLKLSFPVFGPMEVKGKKQSPVFEFFAGKNDNKVNGRVHWVFTKLLINRKGKLVAAFESDTEPDAPELEAAIAKTLANEDLQPKKDKDEEKKSPAPESDDDDDVGRE